MNNDNPSLTGAAPVSARNLLRSRNQTRASALAEGIAVRAKWKTLIAEARTLWPRVGVEEMATVAGNFNRMAGLVQLRHGLSREESDRQVRAFFDKHYAHA